MRPQTDPGTNWRSNLFFPFRLSAGTDTRCPVDGTGAGDVDYELDWQREPSPGRTACEAGPALSPWVGFSAATVP